MLSKTIRSFSGRCYNRPFTKSMCCFFCNSTAGRAFLPVVGIIVLPFTKCMFQLSELTVAVLPSIKVRDFSCASGIFKEFAAIALVVIFPTVSGASSCLSGDLDGTVDVVSQRDYHMDSGILIIIGTNDDWQGNYIVCSTTGDAELHQATVVDAP